MALIDDINNLPESVQENTTNHLSHHKTIHAALKDQVPRVKALESMNGVSPESPVDGQTASLIGQPDTLTNAALREVAVTVREAPLNPYRFGATQEGLDLDHTLPLRRMFEAARDFGEQMVLPVGTWMFRNSDGLGPLPLFSGLKISGSGGSTSRIRSRPSALNPLESLFYSDSFINAVEMRDFYIVTDSRGGNIFETSGIARATFSNMFFNQQLSTRSIWKQLTGDMVQCVFTSCEFQAAPTSVTPWFLLESTTGALNSNTFDKCRFNGLNNTGAPVFRMDEKGGGAHLNDWAFRDIILEQTTGGFIHASGASNWILDNIQSWDANVPHAKDLMRFDSSIGGSRPHNLTFRNVSRHGEDLAPGVYDVNIMNASPAGGVATFINCNTTPYTQNSVISSPSDRTVYIGTRGYSTHKSSGEGSPEGAISGSVGDMYTRTDGGPGSTLYVKESGKNTTEGWVAK